MSMRHWIPPIICAAVLFIGFTVLAARLEDRFTVEQAALDYQLRQLQMDLDTDTRALALEVQQLPLCTAKPGGLPR